MLPLLGAVAAFAIVGSQLQGIISLYPPLWNAYQKKALSSWPNVNPTVTEFIRMRFYEEIDETEYLLRCSEAGINTNYAQKLYTSAYNMLSAGDYVALMRRGEISEEECNGKLSILQYDDDEIALIKKATLFFPNPGDIVRFAVREAYSPEIAAKFGQYEDLPAKFLTEAAKAGLPEEIAKQYWAAHWELPSPNMGFEMFQRRIIDEPTLNMLLRSLDVMPFWRDKLTKLSYNPITRVDVRRMYSMGVMTPEEVTNAYLDIGYSPENAARMTAFTTMDTTGEVDNVSLAALKEAYQKNLITLEQFKSYLKDLSYADSTIQFWVTMSDYDKKNSEVNDLTAEVKAQYKNGLIDIITARKQLESADLPAAYVNHQIVLMQKAASVRTKLPSLGDLTGWLKSNVINGEQFSSRMLTLGFTREDTELYLSEVTRGTDTTKVKYMPLKSYESWYKSGLLTEARFREIMTGMKLNPEDINNEILSLTPTGEEG